MIRSFTAVGALLLTLGGTVLIGNALADGSSDWRDYAWQTIAIADCAPEEDGSLLCPPFHEKWDWKRNQWVDITISIDLAAQTLSLRQQLTDSDKRDSDYVCVTTLVLDRDGENIVVHHQNWRMRAGQSRAADFSYSSARLAAAETVQIGSKQCRDGAQQDDDVYAAVLARMEELGTPPG